MKKIMGAVRELPANLAHFQLNWAGLAVLFSWKLPNSSHDFFSYFQHIFLNYLIKNPKTTIALTFLTHIISATGGVFSNKWCAFR